MGKLLLALTLTFACGDETPAAPAIPPGAPSTPATEEPGAEEPAEPTPTPEEAAPAAWTPTPNTVRMVVLRPEGEPLASEERKLNALEEELATSKGFHWAPAGEVGTVTRVDGAGDEGAAAEAILSEQTPERPSAWNDFETVVIIRLAPPNVSRRGRRTSQGYSGYAVVRAPSIAPRFLEIDAAGGEQ